MPKKYAKIEKKIKLRAKIKQKFFFLNWQNIKKEKKMGQKWQKIGKKRKDGNNKWTY